VVYERIKKRERHFSILLFLDEKKQKSTDSTESLAKISYNGENLSIPPHP
jgi:hypothetical protein